METKFNSQICTSKSQSEALLKLGLKKETADMVYSYEREEHENNYYWELDILESPWDSFIWSANGTCIPAWSLHRLLSLYNLHYIEFMNNEEIKSVYDIVIDAIEQAIKEGYFNKEYLV